MARPIYKIDEVAKALLTGLELAGRQKTFAEILTESHVSFDNDTQIEVANTLEALGLIIAVSYRLPLEIRAELSETGRAIVAGIKKGRRNGNSSKDILLDVKPNYGNSPRLSL